MPHDANGKLLKVGDEVLIPGVITRLGEDNGYCNIDVKLTYPMPAYPDQASTMSAINASQVLLDED